MRDAAPLWDLYDDWKELTEREGNAIRSTDWVEVRRCQRAKEQLRPKIVTVTERLKTQASSDLERTELNGRIRACVNELIELERKNSSTLEQRMAEIQQERAALDETSSRLRKVHQTYAPAQPPIWNQYS
jgi:hypothetical protein